MLRPYLALVIFLMLEELSVGSPETRRLHHPSVLLNPRGTGLNFIPVFLDYGKEVIL